MVVEDVVFSERSTAFWLELGPTSLYNQFLGARLHAGWLEGALPVLSTLRALFCEAAR